jgi:hypothetical protein
MGSVNEQAGDGCQHWSGKGGDVSGVVPATAVVGGYDAVHGVPGGITRAAKAATARRSRTPARGSLQTSLLERLAEHCEDVPPELRAFIRKEHAVVGPRHLPRRRHRPAPIGPTAEMG